MENRNFLVFITISIAILFIWSEFYTKPIMKAEEARLAAQQEQQAELALDTPMPSGASSLSAPEGVSGDRPSLNDDGSIALLSRTEALASARIAFEGEGIVGTISLKGGRIDDVTLKNHRIPRKSLSSHRTAPKAPTTPTLAGQQHEKTASGFPTATASGHRSGPAS